MQRPFARRRHRFSRLSATAVAAIVASCSPNANPPAGLLVLLKTDGTFTPTEVTVHVASVDGTDVLLNGDYHMPETAFPATLGINSNGSPTASVSISATAFVGGQPIDNRLNQIFQIPNDRVAEFDIVFSKHCQVDVNVLPDGGVGSTCPNGFTCNPYDDAGSCTAPVSVDGGSLPTFGLDAGAPLLPDANVALPDAGADAAKAIDASADAVVVDGSDGSTAPVDGGADATSVDASDGAVAVVDASVVDASDAAQPVDATPDTWTAPVDAAPDTWAGPVDAGHDAAQPVDAAPDTWVAPVDAAPDTWVAPVDAAPDTWVAPVDAAPDTWVAPVDSGGGDASGAPAVCPGTCVPEAPAGWTGPFLLYVGPTTESVPACPAGATSPIVVGYADIDASIGAACTTCSCAGISSPTCALDMNIYQSGYCWEDGGSFITDLVTATPSCGQYANGGSNQWYSFYLGTPAPYATWSATPQSSPADPVPPPVGWETIASGCERSAFDEVLPGCASTGLCLPGPSASYTTYCVSSGDAGATCPPQFPNQQTFYTDAGDSRSCTACSCATNSRDFTATGVSCPTFTLDFYSDTSCGTIVKNYTEPHLTTVQCYSLEPSEAEGWKITATPSPTTPPSSSQITQYGGGLTTGTATAGSPVVVCCTP